MHRVIAGLLALALLGLGCSDSTGPDGRTDAELRIIRQDALAPPLIAYRDSFWAKVGDGRELVLSYQGATPADTGEEFLRFEVPGDGLLRRPDGTLFQPGDSILITITVVDSARFQFRFEPAGLQFNPDHPARLRIRYFDCDKDFDGDGDEDADDERIEQQLELWHRSATGGLWFSVGSVQFTELDELDANIRSFSEYAVAW
ncbi:MAG: hypothetical protein WD773_02465 [Gemmatimonadales bacterium]